MFSAFRRRAQDVPEVHDPLRVPLREREALVASLTCGATEQTVHVDLIDLSIAGATLRVPRADDPTLTVDDVASLSIQSASGTWSIQTAVQVYSAAEEPDGSNLLYGVDFVGEGDLFEQLESAAGRWFNRRQHARARPELDKQPTVHLAYKHYHPVGKVFDVSVTGLCVTLDTMAAAPLRMGEPVELTFDLPGIRRAFEGRGTLRSQRRLRNKVYVGIEFDLDRATVLGRRHAELVGYVERRLEAMAAFGRELRAEDAGGPHPTT